MRPALSTQNGIEPMISIPYRVLYPIILAFCGIGVFSVNNATFDVYLMALFGVMGYVFSKLECEPAPMLMAYVLGSMMEEYLRRAMLLSRGDPMVFLERPISLVMLLLAAGALTMVLLPTIRNKRQRAFTEED